MERGFSMQMTEAIESFIRHLSFERRYSAHTIGAYESDLAQFTTYLQQAYEGIDTIADISHHHIRSWLASIKEGQADIKATTLNRKISTLGSFYKWARREGHATKNPVRQLHAMKVPKRLPVSLKESQTSQLLEEISFAHDFRGRTDRMICELLYSTGMRRQEIIALKENDIEWSLRQIRVLGKGNKERLIPVNEVLLDGIREYIKAKKEVEGVEGDNLLVLESGKPLYAGYVYRVVKANLGLVATQKKLSPHVLRHSFATHLLNNGANIQAIKDLLGHSSLAATQVYTHTDIERLKEIHKANHPRG